MQIYHFVKNRTFVWLIPLERLQILTCRNLRLVHLIYSFPTVPCTSKSVHLMLPSPPALHPFDCIARAHLTDFMENELWNLYVHAMVYQLKKWRILNPPTKPDNWLAALLLLQDTTLNTTLSLPISFRAAIAHVYIHPVQHIHALKTLISGLLVMLFPYQ